jgi:SPP1 gp7 family putative phage head morphogenesis protein
MPLVLSRTLKAIRKVARAKPIKHRRRRIPRQQYPILVELEYAEALVGVMRGMRQAMGTLLRELPSLLESAARARLDSSGLTVVIENRRGTTREWKDSDGTEGETLMVWDYGYLAGFTGADGEEVDVYVGPASDAEWVYVVHQQRKAGGFKGYDEDKVMLGFESADAARVAYLAQYDDPRFFGGMSVFSTADFLKTLAARDGGKLIHLDANEGQYARRLVEAMRDRLKAHTDKVEHIAKQFAEKTSTAQRRQMAKQVKAALGVDVLTKDKGLASKVEHFVAENVSLIKSVQNDLHDRVEKIVTRAIVEGRPHDVVAAEIEERFGVSESHAKLIARDQIGKLYGQVNVARQKELGIKRFIWRTVNDERVRDEHSQYEEDSDPDRGGTPFSFDDPPDGELPGIPIMCRCTAEPVMEDLFNPQDE